MTPLNSPRVLQPLVTTTTVLRYISLPRESRALGFSERRPACPQRVPRRLHTCLLIPPSPQPGNHPSTVFTDASSGHSCNYFSLKHKNNTSNLRHPSASTPRGCCPEGQGPGLAPRPQPAEAAVTSTPCGSSRSTGSCALSVSLCGTQFSHRLLTPSLAGCPCPHPPRAASLHTLAAGLGVLASAPATFLLPLPRSRCPRGLAPSSPSTRSFRPAHILQQREPRRVPRGQAASTALGHESPTYCVNSPSASLPETPFSPFSAPRMLCPVDWRLDWPELRQ